MHLAVQVNRFFCFFVQIRGHKHMVLTIRKVMLPFLWVLMLCLPVVSFAQGDLNHTFKKKSLSHASTHKVLKAIYKRPSKNRIYSNECVHDYTSAKMGFEYVILTGDCEKALGNLSGFELELHNFTVKVGLVFTRGPFWRYKVNKRFKFCKERMGEFTD